MSVTRTKGQVEESTSESRPRTTEKQRQAILGTKSEEFVTFMQNRTKCDGCQVLATAGGVRRSERLHIVLSSDYIVVTEAEDLHAPGRTISGRRIAEFPEVTIFRLLAEPAPGANRAKHRAAAGIAVMSWSKRRRRLMATGVLDGAGCAHDRILDAIEE